MKARLVLSTVLSIALTAATSVVSAIPAQAACAASPSPPPTFKQMIKADSTFDDYYHRMIIGRVVGIRDPGKKGGDAKAVVAVAAHPTGFVPLVARVRFYQPPPGTWIEDNLEFEVGQRWVVIARHLHRDGSYQSDGACGRSRPISTAKFKILVALDRRAD